MDLRRGHVARLRDHAQRRRAAQRRQRLQHPQPDADRLDAATTARGFVTRFLIHARFYPRGRNTG
jgi:hypothetical protein